MKTLWAIPATVFGIGRFPVAPGTLASLLTVLLYHVCLSRLGVPYLLLIITAVFAVGVISAGAYARSIGRSDPRPVVIDEVCGQLAALTAVPSEWFPLALAFLLFRILDIFKPFPIGKLESLPGGWGIMVDDMAAGILAALCVHGALRLL
jgi:phosphatidylglycerophosphatase A